MSDAQQGLVLGVKVSAVVWGALGGATAAALGPGTWQHRIATATVGGVFAVALGPPLARVVDVMEADRWGLTLNDLEPAVIYFAGIIGMMACGTVIEMVKRFSQKAPDLVDRVMPDDDR